MSDLGNKEIMAKNIKRLLALSGQTQKQMCKDLGFKESTFSDWVNAKTYPRIDKIELMANYFGVSKADLVESPTPQTKKVPKDLKKILEDEEVTLNGRMMSDEDKEKMMRIIEAAFYEAKEMNKRK